MIEQKVKNAETIASGFKEIQEGAKTRVNESGVLRINDKSVSNDGLDYLANLKSRKAIHKYSVNRSGAGIVVVITPTAD